MRAANLFADIPPPAADEHFETLLARPGLRIERILSHRHASPPGFWYEQPDDEWVLLARGCAELEFDDGRRHRPRHRVAGGAHRPLKSDGSHRGCRPAYPCGSPQPESNP